VETSKSARALHWGKTNIQMFQQTICVDISPLFSIIDGDPTYVYIEKDARALHQDRKKLRDEK
jgi:hypothetical protein